MKEGKIRGACNKGKLHAFKHEIAEGVYVDAYKCDYAHVSYEKEVMEKIETRKSTNSRKVSKIKTDWDCLPLEKKFG